MSYRTLETAALWLAVVAAALMIVGFAGKLANTGRFDPKPLTMSVLMAGLAAGTWVRRRGRETTPTA